MRTGRMCRGLATVGNKRALCQRLEDYLHKPLGLHLYYVLQFLIWWWGIAAQDVPFLF